MPQINKKQIREKPIRWNNERREENKQFYNSMAWHRLRKTFLSTHPLCSECLRHGRVNPAEDIHHLIPFMSGKTDEEKWDLFLKESNIRSLCSDCHHGYHNKMKKYNMKSCFELTDIEYNECHKLK